MALTTKHRKVSEWPNSTNTAKIRTLADWNDSHVFAGGVTGALVARDDSQADGVNGIAAPAIGQQLVSAGVGALPAWQSKVTVDARDFGTEGTGLAIHNAAAYLAARRGGTVDIAAGNWTLDGNTIDLIASAPGLGIRLRGQGMFATTITQADAGADIFVVGETSEEHADFMGICDLTTVGGRRALSLNNCLHSQWSRLRLTGAVVGLYTQGQCERQTFRDLFCINNALHGIHAGNANGGDALTNLDFPILSKSSFDHVHIVGTTGGTALLLTAGELSLGSGFLTSGGVHFRRLNFDSNAKGCVEVQHAVDVIIDGLGAEDYLDADNTYDFLTVGASSQVMLRQCTLGRASFNGVGNYRYYLNADGIVSAIDTVFGTQGAAETKDIIVADTLNLINCTVTDANAITFSGNARRKSTLINVRDSAGTQMFQYPQYYGTVSTYLGELAADADAISIYNKSADTTALNEFFGVHVHNNGAGSGGGNLGIGTKTTADFGGGSCCLALRKHANVPVTTPTNAGVLQVDDTGNLKYYSPGAATVTIGPNTPAVLATGAEHTVDDVITALQALGLVTQA